MTSAAAHKISMRHATILYPLLSRNTGVDIENLSVAAGLSAADCKGYLEVLVAEQFVSKVGKLYYATERLIQVQASDKAEMVKSHVRAGLSLFQEALSLPNSRMQEQLLFRAQYSIHKDRVEDFKNGLRTLLVEFVEASESDEIKL